MSDKTTVVSTGLGLPAILFIVFLVLRLCDVIQWPWYAIAAPLLISWGIGIAFAVVAFIIAMVVAVVGR